MQKSPPPFIWASPEEKNMLDCESLVPFNPYTLARDRSDDSRAEASG